MSDILNCVEQREEMTELEETGGAEVRWTKTDNVYNQSWTHLIPTNPVTTITLPPQSTLE